MRTIALIPAYQEEAFVGQAVTAVLAIPGITQVVVIDDGSKDATGKTAQQAGAQVIRHHKNQGKGAALQSGADKILHQDFDTVLLLDADLGDTARQAELLLGPLEDNLADMTIGVLPKPVRAGGFGVVKDLARSAIRDLGGGYDAQAPLSGQRALTRNCLKAVLPFAQGYGVEVALTIKALKQNLRIYEVMVDMHHRETGRDLPGYLHRAKQYLDVQRTIHHLTPK